MDIKYKENVIALPYLQRYTSEFHEIAWNSILNSNVYYTGNLFKHTICKMDWKKKGIMTRSHVLRFFASLLKMT
jgi:hypothetical protein